MAVTATVDGGSNDNLNVSSPPRASIASKGSAADDAKPTAAPQGQAIIELSRWRFWAIFTSLLLCIFLFALDQLIVATAIPKITKQFNSLTQLPWLASGFL